MSRKRKARLDLSSPALDAIHQDNTVRGPQSHADAPSRIPASLPPKTDLAHPAPLQGPQAEDASAAKREPSRLRAKLPHKSVPQRVQAPDHPLSFRLGITDPSVIATAEALAAQHGADPMLVLKRFVRDAMVELKSNLQLGQVEKFSKVTERPAAQVVLTSTVRMDRVVLAELKMQMDPLDLFAASAVLGFALDQILTEMHGG